MSHPKHRARPTVRPSVEALEDRVVPDVVGAGSASLRVEELRAALGPLNPNSVGSFGSGRREIDWESGLAGVSASGSLSGDYFNATPDGRARGVVFFNPGGEGFRVSQGGSAGAGQVRFGDINPTYADAFRAFSPDRLFTPVGGNVLEVQFFLPGTAIPATTRGFGAIFADVDKAGSTLVEFFDVRGDLLVASPVQPSPGDGSLSFLGLSYPHSPIAKVRITAGEGPLGPNDVTQGGAQDLVVLDDFIFGEPVAFEVFAPLRPQETVEGRPVTFGSAGGNALGVNFRGLAPGAGSGTAPVRVQVSVNNGTLSLSRTTGLTFLTGDGSGDRELVFAGTVADVNAALDGLEYAPDPGFVGADRVTLDAVDAGRVRTVPVVVGPNTLREGPGVFDPATVFWHLRDTASAGFPDVPPFAFGFPTWVPVAGDWDGDGFDTIGMVDNTGAGGPFSVWYKRDSNAMGPPDGGAFAYGVSGWVPLVGDWDGDGLDTVGMFDPFTGMWYLRNSNGPGAPDAGAFAFGLGSWIPLVGDWDGDGRDTVGMFDPFTGTWYLRNSNGPGAPDAGAFAYGLGTWYPVVGDWDGDGADGVGIIDVTGWSDFVTGQGAVWYLRNTPGNGAPEVRAFPFGHVAWKPLVGRWGPAEALRAEGVGRGGAALTLGGLEALVSAAGSRLSGAGVDPSVVRLLAGAPFAVADLPGGLLGLAAGGRVWIDRDAAGLGWFVDATPLEDEEFAGGVAVTGGGAEGRVDLLSVVLHELGHLAGLGHADGGLMADELGVGARRVEALDAVFSGRD